MPSKSGKTASSLVDLRRLVIAAQQGDIDAYTSLFTRFHHTIYRLALAKLRDEHTARDATHDVFILAFQRLPQLKRVDAFSTWIRRIVSTCCKAVARQQ